MMRRIDVLALVFTASACLASGPKQEIANLRETWGQDLRGKQLDHAMSLYTDDAVFFEPGGAQTQGKAEIRALFAKVMKTFNSEIHFRPGALDLSGRLAYDSGEYQETLINNESGARMEVHGSYLMVLRREPDGRWRIVQHMWTVATAP